MCFVEASGQNAFFGELLAALRHAVERRGVATEIAVDHFPSPVEDLVYLFVPHEYLPLTEEAAHPDGEHLRRTVVISSEQPGSSWFEHTAALAGVAGATLDINPLGLAELRRRGIAAQRLQLGYVPEWDAWGGSDEQTRPVDVTFLGGYAPHRGRVLASCGQVLKRRRTELRLVESDVPHTAGSPQFLAGAEKWKHLASAKTLLNIHRDTNPYFEWQRVVEAIANGCVVVTEHSLGFQPLVPGEHFVSASAESLPLVLDALLQDEELLGEIRDRAYEFLRSELPLDASVDALVDAVHELADSAFSSPTVTAATHPLPRRVSPPAPEWAQFDESPTDARFTRMALKHLILAQRGIERRLERLEVTRRHAARTAVREFGTPAAAPPQVTVVVPLHNYEDYIEEALWSVALSDYPSLELVVVDDASTDRSAKTAAETLQRASWIPSKLVTLQRNRGLPRARNAGVDHASGELVFMLDADNCLYPHAIDRLVSALDERPEAAFAYGILEQFDASRSMDIQGWLDWNPARLARGNYIDATALIRRSALKRVGGYTTDTRLFGWEDFALWCAFAELGLEGVLVPEIVARYRTGHVSMISLTNIDTSDAWAALLERYSFLRDQGVSVDS
jgi:hypothetical protein